MMYAELNGHRIVADPAARRAYCRGCKGRVIAKCGDVRIWHWAHESGVECDPFHDPETEWHRRWKERFPEEMRENWIEKGGVQHRADIQLPNGKVVEFQNSHLKVEGVEARESFYDRPIWILNGENFASNFIPSPFMRLGVYSKKLLAFTWRSPRPGFSHVQRLAIDINEGVFVVHSKKVRPFASSLYGHGRLVRGYDLISKTILEGNEHVG